MAKHRNTALVVLATALVSGAGLGGSAAAAPAAPVQCSGVLTGEYESIVVPKHAPCTLSGAHVLGDVVVLRRGALRTGADSGRATVIDGNVVAHHPRLVLLQYKAQVAGDFRVLHPLRARHRNGFDIGVSIGGDATIAGSAGYTFVDSAHVGGDLRVRGNSGGLEIEWNTVDGLVAIRDNAPVGTASVYHNTVGQSMSVVDTTGSTSKVVSTNSVTSVLRCHGNDSPFIGSPNEAQQLLGQCRPQDPLARDAGRDAGMS